MADGQLLRTILHISDLHIGRVDPVTGDAELSRSAAWLLSNFTWFDGVLGHHARALQDLDAYYAGLTAEGDPPLLIVSGDVTRVGHGDEFDAAYNFLAHRLDLNPPTGNLVGLQYASWRAHAIPGNHDHWPGTATIVGGPTAALRLYFPNNSLPYVRAIPLANGRTIHLIGVNTDADVRPFGQKRIRAVGSFQKQLAAVAPHLGARKEREIRVLLMHHSWHHHGPLLSIDRGTRGALNQFLVDHGIQLILSGHTHRPLIQQFVPPVPGAHPVLECRCGTTTQNDQVPYGWRTLFGAFPNRSWPENTLLVHRIYDDHGTTHWYVEAFLRTRGQGFVAIGPTARDSLVV